MAEVMSGFINLFLQLFRKNDNEMAMKISETNNKKHRTTKSAPEGGKPTLSWNNQ